MRPRPGKRRNAFSPKNFAKVSALLPGGGFGSCSRRLPATPRFSTPVSRRRFASRSGQRWLVSASAAEPLVIESPNAITAPAPRSARTLTADRKYHWPTWRPETAVSSATLPAATTFPVLAKACSEVTCVGAGT